MHDMISAGAQRLSMVQLDTISLDEQMDLFFKALNFTRNTSNYNHFIKGFQKLYDFKELYFTETNIPVLSAQIEANYAEYRAWFDASFKKAGFQLMLLDQYWNRYNTEVDERYFALVFNINTLIMQVSDRPSPGEKLPALYKLAMEEEFTIHSLDDYLKFCDFLFQRNIEHKAVCIKNTVAYGRSLVFDDVPYETARKLFDKPSSRLTPVEAKKLQDHIFHWIIQKSIEYDLPIQIHTGYLAGNGNVLDNGKPIKLNNLFMKYPKADFILFHGGYPWTGEYVALGKMFPNVYLDMVWLPQLSRETAIQTLEEMFDCVPYNKIFWGGDCAFIENAAGSLEYGKEVVAEVLSRRIERGLLTTDVAFDIIRRIFRENAIEVFKLEKRLGREF